MPDERVAVLIGNATFPESPGQLGSLRCPPADVRGLARVLGDKECGGFTDVITLLDEPSHVILPKLNQRLNKLDREDLVLIYYSGHGKLDPGGQLHLAAKNTDVNALLATAVPLGTVKEMLRYSRCQRRILLLDCCYSGAVGSVVPKGAVDEQLQIVTREAGGGIGTFIMTASTGIQAALEKEGDEYSVFTKYLIQGVESGEADLDGDGAVTVDDLYEYVRSRVRGDSTQDPMYWQIGATGTLTVARVAARRVGADVLARLQTLLDGLRLMGYLPQTVYDAAEAILKAPQRDRRDRYELQYNLLLDLGQKKLNPGEFLDKWYQVRTGLAHTDNASEVEPEERWDTARDLRGEVFDLTGPGYLLDSRFHFIDWNPLFDKLLAKPMGLVRGHHVEDLVLQLDNSVDVINRSLVDFRPGQSPLVHGELLTFRSPDYGLIKFHKLASQIPGKAGDTQGWLVHLNVLSAEKEEEFWKDVEACLRTEVNWSRYATLYDRMLLKFGEYDRLIKTVTGMVPPAAATCADLASGTGNGTFALLAGRPDRKVWALEANERMLECFRGKLDDRDLSDRVVVVKGNLILSLREFDDKFFDAVVMVNALYALDEPQRCLLEIFRVLKPGGVLALSTSHTGTDIDRLFKAIREDLAAKDQLDELRHTVDDAYARHVAMLDHIRRDSKEMIYGYVESAGFKIVEKIDPAYVGAVVIVRAEKPKNCA
jgi:ubiquinone/menaquinone biosynthesis C-methylase UbiE